jgi:hypothetical protein
MTPDGYASGAAVDANCTSDADADAEAADADDEDTSRGFWP